VAKNGASKEAPYARSALLRVRKQTNYSFQSTGSRKKIVMKIIKSLQLLLAVFVFVGGHASAQSSGVSSPNSEIISMVKAKVPDAVILGYISNNPRASDGTPSGLIALNSAGASSAVMQAVVAMQSSNSGAVPLQRSINGSGVQPLGRPSDAMPSSTMTASQRADAEEQSFQDALQNFAVFTSVAGTVVELTNEPFTQGAPMMSGSSMLLSAVGAGYGNKALLFNGRKSLTRVPKLGASFLISYPKLRMPSPEVLNVVRLSLPALLDKRGINVTGSTGGGGTGIGQNSMSYSIERNKIMPISFETSSVVLSTNQEMQSVSIKFSRELPAGEYAVLYAGRFFTFGID
jgi:hypothetical protein